MRRVALIYNPASGQHSGRRSSYIQKALELLRKEGIEAESLETHAPGSAKALALGAVRQGYDAVLACGGDGTVHEACSRWWEPRLLSAWYLSALPTRWRRI